MELKDLDLRLIAAEAAMAPPALAAPPSAEFVARRFAFLTADGQVSTPLEQEALLGTNDLVEMSFLERCMLVRRAIGRIKVSAPNRRGWATAFLVAPGLVMTNHHVFPDAASVGNSRVTFDYWHDVSGQLPANPDEFELQPNLFFVSNEQLDYAVVAIAATSSFGRPLGDRRHIRLIPMRGKVKQGEFVTILQHPEGEPMQVALRENKIIRADEHEDFLWYAADTAHGSSGAPVFNDTLQLVALHASGRIERAGNGEFVLARGGTTARLEGLSETDVKWEANVGYRVSSITANLLAQIDRDWPAWIAPMQAALNGGDAMSTAIQALKEKSGLPAPETELKSFVEEEVMVEKMKSLPATAAAQAGLVVPFQLRVILEPGSATPQISSVQSTDAAAFETEAMEMRTPIIFDGLDERPGFDRQFLDAGNAVPMPALTAAGRKIVAPLLEGGGSELKYKHFSVWMQKERRLALFTASNVNWRGRRKTVEGKSTSRDALAGFPPNARIAELWVEDPRIDSRHQLPDVFYTEDRAAFDKGHLVRRDDVCFGERYDDIQMANGDTFHVTNCSPQIKEFNQGPRGEENWGDLEEAIARITRQEAELACIFAGPVFKANDRWFRGKDDNGSARIQIPGEFWKVVVVNGDAGYEAYGFLLRQDIRKITEKEFFVTDEWVASWKPISEIAGKMRDWLDFDALEAVDKHA